jgi:2-oxoglutarate dehydrogenase E1 component
MFSYSKILPTNNNWSEILMNNKNIRLQLFFISLSFLLKSLHLLWFQDRIYYKLFNSMKNIISPVNIDYLDSYLEQYLENPALLNESLKSFFDGYILGLQSNTPEETSQSPSAIQWFREQGHYHANINPLQNADGTKSFLPEQLKNQTEKSHIERLSKIYLDTVGFEISHLLPEERNWFFQKIESSPLSELARPFCKIIYQHLLEAEEFESFLHRTYPGQKRFSIEGLESLIPMLNFLIKHGADAGIQWVNMGMAHRGRLNILANVLHKPLSHLLSEFDGPDNPNEKFDGDVKYHLGYLNKFQFDSNHITVELSHNPSHLELVNSVVLGKAKCRQKEFSKESVLPVILHGDAALSGQGINLELLQLSCIKGFRVGGAIHIVANNQIGFTALPFETRSTCHPTDIFKIIPCPVLHVNGDDPEAAVAAALLALEYRQKWNKDIAINLIGYRRHGHNEGDNPSFTQPLLYQKIQSHPTPKTIYGDRLLKTGSMTESEQTSILERTLSSLKNSLSESRQLSYKELEPQKQTRSINRIKTGIDESLLNRISTSITKLPESYNFHKRAEQFWTKRTDMLTTDTIDWAFAEALAFGSLLCEGHTVRLTGQDSIRGTFTQRHLLLRDQKTNDAYIPLNHIQEQQQKLEVYNSILSEVGVLGFEYGYSTADDSALVLWEAQFGDFSNGAQSIIDTYIASSGSKWQRNCRLTLLLPHGHEGQGPEHTSARPERYLQLCAEDNLRVIQPTTPANYFHALRRQISSLDARPLIVFTPKSLLRNKDTISSKEEFLEGTTFQTIIPKNIKSLNSSNTLILASGKICIELEQEIYQNKQIACPIVRVEQLYPFPAKEIQAILRQAPHIENILWVQEERKNMGAWSFVAPIIQDILSSQQKLHYIGRKAGASPSEGQHSAHNRNQQQIIASVLGYFLKPKEQTNE